MGKQKFIGIFWNCTPAGWIEVRRVFVCDSKDEAQAKATQIEDNNPGLITFVGWEGEVE